MAEQLTFRNFNKQREKGSIALSLVGMSNVGKSFWSNRLRDEAGFRVYGCDDEIEDRLGEQLRSLGYAGGIEDVARWMGQPYDPQFANTQAEYLRLEAGVTAQALDEVGGGDSAGNVVIDTTGSVVHLDPRLRQRVSSVTTTVYLEATDDMQAEMFARYIENPKPVVWGDIYRPQVGEDPQASLRRLYPSLLACRSALYSQMARVTVKREDTRHLHDSENFLELVKHALKCK